MNLSRIAIATVIHKTEIIVYLTFTFEIEIEIDFNLRRVSFGECSLTKAFRSVQSIFLDILPLNTKYENTQNCIIDDKNQT